ncbi:aspartic proteinase nepenthesin-1-like [Nymphaea colorata]|nr:aspartic proteinase nepenthesin-1-like [Nymphaea colorata]
MEGTPKLQQLPSFLLILFFAVYVLPFSASTAAGATTATTIRVQIKLIHGDAHRNLTYQQHLDAGLRRTQDRAMHLLNQTMKVQPDHRKSSPPSQKTSTVQSKIQGYHGEYIMRLAVGTPPTSFFADIDTGSPLTWAKCPQLEDPLFDPKSSSSYSKVPCSNPLCNITGAISICDDDDQSCDYGVMYGDGSLALGTLSWETFHLGPLTVKNVAFGCSFFVGGFDHMQPAIVAFNRGPLSLISQLGPLIGHQFSYCLGGFEASDQSKLTLGPSSDSIRSNATISVPLLVNPSNPDQYFVALQGISVGGKRLPIPESAFQFGPNGNGGVVVDSGTTIMTLVPKAYSHVKEAFVKGLGQLTQVPHLNDTLQFDACFHGVPNSNSIPTFTLHFDGGDLQVPIENYILRDEEMQKSCLAIIPSPTPANIIGATTMQNFHVNFDLGANTITFTRVQCSKL